MYKFSVAILRVSTTEQTVENQRRPLEEELARRNLISIKYSNWKPNKSGLAEQPNTCILIEEDKTDHRKIRATFRWLLDQVRGGKVSSVIALRSDRIIRNTSASLELAEACKSKSTELYTLREKVDLCSPSGNLQFTILSAIAQYEKDVISERVKDAYQRAVREAAEQGLASVQWGGKKKGDINGRTYNLLEIIRKKKEKGWSNVEIAQATGLHRSTVIKIVKRIKINDLPRKPKCISKKETSPK